MEPHWVIAGSATLVSIVGPVCTYVLKQEVARLYRAVEKVNEHDKRLAVHEVRLNLHDDGLRELRSACTARS